MLNIVMDPLFS